MEDKESKVSVVMVAHAFTHKEAVMVSPQETLAASEAVEGARRYISLAVRTVVPAWLCHLW